MLVMVLPRRLGYGVVLLLSHVGDGAIEVTLVVSQCHCRVMLVMAVLR
jgi:hypothetical protein